MKICPHCNAQNYDNASVCFRCNFPFYQYPAGNDPQMPQNYPYAMYKQPQPYVNQNYYQNTSNYLVNQAPYQSNPYPTSIGQNNYNVPNKNNRKNKNKVSKGKITIIILGVGIVFLALFMVIFKNTSKAKYANTVATRTAIMSTAEAAYSAQHPTQAIPTKTPRPSYFTSKEYLENHSNSSSSSSSSSSSGYSRSSIRTLSVGDDHFSDVWFCAQDIVKSELKAPRSAKFCSQYEVSIKNTGGNDYTIIGYVDAQNSFGAMIRNNFVVTMTLTSGGYKNGTVTFL